MKSLIVARRVVLGFALLLPAGNAPAEAPALHVYAPMTLKNAIEPITAAFRAAQGQPVQLVLGPTPALAKQVAEGAPADVFISADELWMDYLEKRGLIRAGTRADLVGNTLVLIAARGNPLAARLAPGFPLADHLDGKPLAMCNPESHPAGRFGRTSLESLGLWPSVAGRVARLEHVQMAVAMVARGDVALGIVFATDVAGNDRVKIVDTFPESSHPRIVVPAAAVAASKHPKAGDFVAFLRSEAATQVFRENGYRILN